MSDYVLTPAPRTSFLSVKSGLIGVNNFREGKKKGIQANGDTSIILYSHSRRLFTKAGDPMLGSANQGDLIN